MKGIILAGGYGTRLYPLTKVTSKQLLPVYDKPMIYYPLSTLMLAKIQEILIISDPEDVMNFQRLLGDGHQFGIRLSYCTQNHPNGIAHALALGKDFIGNDSSVMILGDNIFYGNGFSHLLQRAADYCKNGIATIFGYYVSDPKRFGVVEFDKTGKVVSVEEKPKHPKSDYAITGLYFYPPGVALKAIEVQPSSRGEKEITTLNNMYLQENRLNVELLGRGFAWFDAGTVDSLADATDFVRMLEKHQGIMFSVPEEIAYRYGWINNDVLWDSSEKYKNSNYGAHLKAVAEGRIYTDLR